MITYKNIKEMTQVLLMIYIVACQIYKIYNRIINKKL
jgi:hypothetical protein